MLTIKESKMEQLVNFGFRKGPKFWNHESQNIKIDCESRAISVTNRGYAAYSISVPNAIVQLVKADMVEEA